MPWNAFGMDVWIAVDADNQQKVLLAIRDFGFPAAPDDLLHEEDAMVRMGRPPLRIEVLKKISGVEFEDSWQRRVIIEDADVENTNHFTWGPEKPNNGRLNLLRRVATLLSRSEGVKGPCIFLSLSLWHSRL